MISLAFLSAAQPGKTNAAARMRRKKSFNIFILFEIC